jgi:hypothetical protein
MTTASSQAPTNDVDSVTLLRAALEILDVVRRMLEALSPTEIELTLRCEHRGATKNELAFFLGEYERRHRVFALTFELQHSLFVTLTREHFKRACREGESS